MTAQNHNKWQEMRLVVHKKSLQLELKPGLQFKKLYYLRLISENILTFLLQYIGFTISLLYPHASLMWFGTGTSCAYLFLRGYSVLPGILLGIFCAYYFAHSGFLLALICTLVICFQALLLLWFCYYFLHPTLIFYTQNSLFKFIGFTSALSAVTGAALVFMCYPAVHGAGTPLELWLQWWLANLNAILIFSCAVITWDAYFPRSYSLNQLNNVLLRGFYVLLLFCTLALMFSYSPMLIGFLVLAILLVTGGLSICFGWCHSITALFLSGIILSTAGFLDTAIFFIFNVSDMLIFLQFFLCINAIFGLSLAVKCNRY